MNENLSMAIEPREQLRQIRSGLYFTRLLYVAAKFGLADQLSTGPKDAAEIAAAVGADPTSLYRLMRSLTMIGAFTLRPDGRFALVATSGYNRHELSLIDLSAMIGQGRARRL